MAGYCPCPATLPAPIRVPHPRSAGVESSPAAAAAYSRWRWSAPPPRPAARPARRGRTRWRPNCAAARADSELAAAAAKAAPPGIAPALIEVSADPRPPCDRARRGTVPSGRATDTDIECGGDPSECGAGRARPPRPQDVIAALRRSAENAAKLAPTLSGYRAGLLGSIAAACTAASTIGSGRPPGARDDVLRSSDRPRRSDRTDTGPGPAGGRRSGGAVRRRRRRTRRDLRLRHRVGARLPEENNLVSRR